MQHMTFCNQTANGHWQTSPPLPFSILLEQIALFAQKNPSATCKIKLTPLIICVKQIYYNFHYTQFIASQNHTGTSAFLPEICIETQTEDYQLAKKPGTILCINLLT